MNILENGEKISTQAITIKLTRYRLDLYFLDAYFGLDVPVKALSNNLLKFAACAYAAKHLSRISRKNHSPEPSASRASTTIWPNSENVDWAWYGAKYYAQAITLLRETLQQSHHIGDSPNQSFSPNDIENRLGQDSSSNLDSWVAISEEALAAMAILCNYEYMSASDAEWSKHLSGTMLLLDLKRTGLTSPMTTRPSKARRAIFWNFFRQDCFAACKWFDLTLLRTHAHIRYSHP